MRNIQSPDIPGSSAQAEDRGFSTSGANMETSGVPVCASNGASGDDQSEDDGDADDEDEDADDDMTGDAHAPSDAFTRHLEHQAGLTDLAISAVAHSNNDSRMSEAPSPSSLARALSPGKLGNFDDADYDAVANISASDTGLPDLEGYTSLDNTGLLDLDQDGYLSFLENFDVDQGFASAFDSDRYLARLTQRFHDTTSRPGSRPESPSPTSRRVHFREPISSDIATYDEIDAISFPRSASGLEMRENNYLSGYESGLNRITCSPLLTLRCAR